MNDRAFYEQFWSGFTGAVEQQVAIHRESRRPLLKLLARSLPPDRPARFLEVGCGTAIDSCLLARAHPRAAAFVMDLSEQALSIARRNAAAVNAALAPLAGDLVRLPFSDAAFDLVFSQGVLEHFEDPAPAMREQARVLRPGGILIVDVPQKFNVYTLRKQRLMKQGRWPWGWETQYSLAELRAWAPRYGLEFLSAAGYQHGRILDRLVIHPHRMLRNKLRRNGNSSANGYQPGALARFWESAWDWLDERAGPYLAINVAVAYRKPGVAAPLEQKLR